MYFSRIFVALITLHYSYSQKYIPLYVVGFDLSRLLYLAKTIGTSDSDNAIIRYGDVYVVTSYEPPELSINGDPNMVIEGPLQLKNSNMGIKKISKLHFDGKQFLASFDSGISTGRMELPLSVEVGLSDYFSALSTEETFSQIIYENCDDDYWSNVAEKVKSVPVQNRQRLNMRAIFWERKGTDYEVLGTRTLINVRLKNGRVKSSTCRSTEGLSAARFLENEEIYPERISLVFANKMSVDSTVLGKDILTFDPWKRCKKPDQILGILEYQRVAILVRCGPPGTDTVLFGFTITHRGKRGYVKFVLHKTEGLSYEFEDTSIPEKVKLSESEGMIISGGSKNIEYEKIPNDYPNHVLYLDTTELKRRIDNMVKLTNFECDSSSLKYEVIEFKMVYGSKLRVSFFCIENEIGIIPVAIDFLDPGIAEKFDCPKLEYHWKADSLFCEQLGTEISGTARIVGISNFVERIVKNYRKLKIDITELADECEALETEFMKVNRYSTWHDYISSSPSEKTKTIGLSVEQTVVLSTNPGEHELRLKPLTAITCKNNRFPLFSKPKGRSEFDGYESEKYYSTSTQIVSDECKIKNLFVRPDNNKVVSRLVEFHTKKYFLRVLQILVHKLIAHCQKQPVQNTYKIQISSMDHSTVQAHGYFDCVTTALLLSGEYKALTDSKPIIFKNLFYFVESRELISDKLLNSFYVLRQISETSYISNSFYSFPLMDKLWVGFDRAGMSKEIATVASGYGLDRRGKLRI